jgi:NADH-quinone oxidoreductase subunit L
MMMAVVTFVSFLVHVYTIGYMRDDPGYSRFFAYISFFTFAMLMLVSANNFLQMFFGWEGVGLASYLLIGFWFTRETAIKAGFKAFVMNRIGDFGFIIGIGLLFATIGTMNFSELFERAPWYIKDTVPLWGGVSVPVITTACIALFIGAMGKSAQMPLHVWLPDSMEGPTPISALIHAATMVTAGIYMVARMSPVFELSSTALAFITIVGATTGIFMAILGLVQNDIKRVIAYSTLSQLGYMTVALGVSVYSAALFHLMTHAFFKALLFLAAGSVIIAMHHQQDLRKMGGLRKQMPVTYVTALIGAWALAGLPPFSGFFSKEPIITAAWQADVFGHGYAAVALTVGVFLTACYTFRMFFLAFHGEPRWDHHDAAHLPKESPWVMTVPLALLAIPSIIIGALLAQPMLYGDFFGQSLKVLPEHGAMAALMSEWHGVTDYLVHGMTSLPFVLAVFGILTAWLFTLQLPKAMPLFTKSLGALYNIFLKNYYFDALYQALSDLIVWVGKLLNRVVENVFVGGLFFNLPSRIVEKSALVLRKIQTGYLYHYATAMVLGLVVFLTVWGM